MGFPSGRFTKFDPKNAPSRAYGSTGIADRRSAACVAGTAVRAGARPVAKHRRRDESWDLHITEPHSGYVRVAFYIKAPGLIFVLPSVINANAGAGADSARIEFPIFNPDRGAQ